MNIKSALDVSNRSVSFREAEILLCHVLKVSKEWLITHPDELISQAQEKEYLSFLDRRERNEPVAYITGVKEFYSRTFKIDSRALIPRPETEALIDIALDWARNSTSPINILELGTGCGNIAITLNLELSQKNIQNQILATDIDEKALELAQENCLSLKTSDALELIPANLFDHKLILERKPYNLIIANLPYVPNTWKMHPEAQKDVLFYEPDVALFGGEDGLDIYRCFFQQVPSFLAKDGIIVIEFSEDHGEGITALGKTTFPFAKIKIQPDYAGLDRVLIIES